MYETGSRRLTRQSTFWMLAALAGLAALVRYRGLAFGLPHTQARPDETVIIDAARALLSKRLPQFYDYPWLFIELTSIAYLPYYVWGLARGAFHTVGDMVASWPVHWEPFFLIVRAASATCGTLSVLMAYRLGRQIHDEVVGLLSALFLTFAFIHVRDSHFGTTDVAMTFVTLCAVSLLLDAHQTPSTKRFALAGLIAGLAAATKYNAVLLLVPAAVSFLLNIVEARRQPRRAAFDARLLVFGAAFAVTFSLGVPFVVLAREPFLDAMRALVLSMQVGEPRLDLDNGWLHHLQFSLRYGLGLPLLVASLAGIVMLLRSRPRTGAIVLAFPIAYYLVAGTVRNLFFRYMIPVVPFLCVCAAFAICRTAERITSRARSGAAYAVLTTAAALAVAAPSAVNVWRLDNVLRATDNRVVVSRWFAEHVPVGSSVLQSGSRYGLAQFDRRLGYNEWRWDNVRRRFTINGRSAEGRPDWIVLQDSPLPSATQSIVLDFLRESYDLVGVFPAVTTGSGMIYDRMDAFFVPFTELDKVERPGPNFSVFRRRHAHDAGFNESRAHGVRNINGLVP